MTRNRAAANTTSLTAMFRQVRLFKKTLQDSMAQARGIRQVKAAYPVMVTRYFSR